MQAVTTTGGPRLVGQYADQEAPISLVKLKAEAHLNGLFARTALTCTFLNECDATMEGEFLLRLPAGATVTGYALDVGGTMVDGVIVDKDKSRITFESERYRRVDPGLVESVDGQVFRTRVYPILGFRTRTVRLEYIQPLAAHEGRLFYRLPFNGYPELAELEVKVVAQDLPASVELTRNPFTGVTPSQTTANGFTLAATLKNIKPDGELVLGCRYPEGPLLDVARIDDETVAFTAALPLPKSPAPKRGGPRQHMVLYWDASAGVSDAGRRRARDFLTQFLSHYREVLQVDLVVFRNEQEPALRFTRAQNGFRDLLTTLAELAADGGTNLFDLSAPNEGDFAMLVSDGRDVINGLGVPDFGMPVLAVQPETFGSDPLMRAMAKYCEGDYIDLSNTTTAAAVAQWGRAVAHLHAADKLSDRVTALTESAAGSLADRLWISGRVRGNSPLDLPLAVGYTDETAVPVIVRVDPAQARTDGMAATWWAQSYVRDLLAQPYAHRDEIIALAKRHRLTTPFTSLIVLESLEQYLRHRIEPPASLPAMRASYHEAMADSSDTLAEYVAEYRKDVLTNFAAWVNQLSEPVDPPTDLGKLRRDNLSRWGEEMTALQADQVKASPLGTAVASSTEGRVEPESGQTSPSSFKPLYQMVAAPATQVAGRLLDRDQQPVAGMTITLWGHPETGESQVVKTVQSDAAGQFRIDALPNGVYSVNIEHPDYMAFKSPPFALMGRRSFQVQPRIVPDPTKPVELMRGHAASVVVNAVDPAGEPLPGIVMRLVEAAHAGRERASANAVTNAAGRAELKGLKPGAYTLSGVLPFFEVIAVEPLPPAAGQTTLTVVLQQIERLVEYSTIISIGYNEPQDGETVAVSEWSAEIPYVAALDRVEADARYQTYLNLREQHAHMPAFYLDSARVFFKHGQVQLGKRILTNLLEMGVEDAVMKRMTAFVFCEFGLWEEADNLYEKLVRLRPEWPQARRERALVLAERGRLADAAGDPAAAKAYFGSALALLGDVLWRPWGDVPEETAAVYLEDSRYQGFDILAATDYRGLLQEAQRRFGPAARNMAYAPLAQGVDGEVEADLMVTLAWDDVTANMNLWVIEPSGEPCFFDNEATKLGGVLSGDADSGMGPEAYMIRKALPGDYQIVAHYFGSQRIGVNGPTTCVATIIYHFGRAEERRETYTIRLDQADSAKTIAVVRWGDPVR